ncbi:MAG: succinate--CoA ligase subunit beta, partial [Candidatus Zixiibacteriota bacterium]
MRLYEYEGKELFAKFNIPIPEGRLAASSREVEAIATEWNKPIVLKSQVLTGGRGKAGGVKVVENTYDAKAVAEKLFEMKIKGFPVEK